MRSRLIKQDQIEWCIDLLSDILDWLKVIIDLLSGIPIYWMRSQIYWLRHRLISYIDWVRFKIEKET